MKNQQTITSIVVAVGVSALSFLGGLKYAEMNPKIISPSEYGAGGGYRMMDRNGQGGGTQQGTGRQGGTTMRNGFRPVFGEILDIDGSTMTVKLTDGSTKIVVLTDKTTASTQTEAKVSEIKTGEKVSVMGTTNTDGTVTADSIQINPVMRNFPSPSASPEK